MRKLLALVLASALGSVACAAPPTEDSINELLTVTRTQSVLEGYYKLLSDSFRQGMNASLEGKNLTDAQKRVVEAFPEKFAQAMREELGWNQLQPMYVQIYQETFTQEEIDGLIAFYKSPSGAAFVAKMPTVLAKSQTVMQGRIRPFILKMNTLLDQGIVDAKAAK